MGVKNARDNSVYWQATESQTPDMALFFIKAATPHYMKDAPGGEKVDTGKLARRQGGIR